LRGIVSWGFDRTVARHGIAKDNAP
jgi:hypothetical protein